MLEKADADAERKAVQKAVKAHDAVQTVIDKGYQRLDSGEITVDTNQLLRASDIKMRADSKQKDQQLALIEMIAHFASGSDKNERVYIDNEVPAENSAPSTV
jgi:hypothetical protein